MSLAKITFYGVPSAAPTPLISGEVIPFPKSVSRKATLRVAGRVLGKALTRAIPFAGAALTAWELYDYINSEVWNFDGVWTETSRCRAGNLEYQLATAGSCASALQLFAGYVPWGTPQTFNFKKASEGRAFIGPDEFTTPNSTHERIIARRIAVNPYALPDGLEVPYPGPQPNPNFGPSPLPHPDPLPEFNPYPATYPKGFQAPRPETGPLPRARPRPRPSTLPSPHWEFETPPSGPRPPRAPRLRPRVVPRPVPTPDEEPYPDPLPSPKLEPFVPLPSRPKEGTKERKFRGTYTAFQILNAVSEVAEVVDCLYNSLPSTKIRNDYNAAYAAEMKDFWKQYNANVKSGLIRTARDKAIFLDSKPKYNKKMASPLKAAKKARKGNYANNTKNLGIQEADIKAKYIYDNFNELNAGVMGEALQCTIIDQYVDKFIARGVPRGLVTKARERARNAQRNIRKGRL